jgi:hypothetical protein
MRQAGWQKVQASFHFLRAWFRRFLFHRQSHRFFPEGLDIFSGSSYRFTQRRAKAQSSLSIFPGRLSHQNLDWKDLPFSKN